MRAVHFLINWQGAGLSSRTDGYVIDFVSAVKPYSSSLSCHFASELGFSLRYGDRLKQDYVIDLVYNCFPIVLWDMDWMGHSSFYSTMIKRKLRLSTTGEAGVLNVTVREKTTGHFPPLA